MTELADDERISPRSALAWALFLGVSWTWVIGMFLPVLLVRDYGVWAWFVFAIPNVIGAAAMGWKLRDPAHSRQMVASHDAACTAFSFVTIAFHVFFLGWFLAAWLPVRALLPGLAIAGFAYASLRAGAGIGLIALLTYVFSLANAVLFVRTGGVGIVATGANRFAWHNALIWLTPVCVLGFALNPYLDLTFHAARQRAHSLRTSRVAFGVGFGIVFCSMIVFTLLYSRSLWSAVRLARAPESEASIWFVIGHILFQACFTIGVHTAAATSRFAIRNWIVWAAAVGIGSLAAAWARQASPLHDLLAGEFVYRLFMAAYGLVFPAYAWLCMVPSWHDPRPPTRRAILVLIAVVALASPCFWLAFIDGRMVWLVPGVLIVLAGRIFLPRRAFAA